MCAQSFKRILIGVDAGDACVHAVELAAQLARAFSAEVMLIHITQFPEMMPPDLVPTMENVRDILDESARRLLESVSRPLAPDVPSRCIVDQGNAAEKILQAAAEWHADLIILGTRGYGRLAHFIAGSTGEAVIHGATCPVLICPKSCSEPATQCAEQSESYVLEAYAR